MPSGDFVNPSSKLHWFSMRARGRTRSVQRTDGGAPMLQVLGATDRERQQGPRAAYFPQ